VLLFFLKDKIGKRLGFGGSSEVYEVTNIITGKKQVLKKIPILTSLSSSLTSSSTSRSLESEMVIGKVLGKKCPFLVHYKEIFSEGENEYIVMELFPDGDLQTYLNRGKKLTEKVYFQIYDVLNIYFILFYFFSTGFDSFDISIM
jgi:serine/threonine protein kinase